MVTITDISKACGVSRATRALLALPERPTCIFYPDDLSFLGGMSELEKHGLSIPKDMSVVWTFRAVSSKRSFKKELIK
ncbi:MAG: hypothetical protein K6G56_01570 [Clostridiales bacterium]|nr:hypothetical protein [Clostridiales bacterium]